MKKNKNIQRSWTAVTYPQDFCESGAVLGPQTILRLQKLVDTQKEGRFQISHVVLACGIGPDTREYPLQIKSFAVMMKDWLVAEGTFDASVIHCSRDDSVWNCIEVTIEMLRVIRGFNLSRNVLVVSTGFHLYPRMWVTWRLLCRRKHCWNIAFVPAWKGTYDVVHELLGTIKYIPIALWYRFNGRV